VSATSATLRLFGGVGIEIEYMIVDADGLSVRPIADELLREVGGGYELEFERGPLAWSNELALHVIELKTNGPAADLGGLGALFQQHVGDIESILARYGARLMPTAMHPWMDPDRELRLWPHENDVIYKTFDRIFGCRGHGWANVQSMHINLPFGDDDEFGRLHASIRAALPLLPALAASSPFVDGAPAAVLDARMAAYRDNARRVPSVSGAVVPEPVFSKAEYEGGLLQRIYDDLAPLDPEGVLRHEWVNARGCIARFDRDAIEIRVLDTQECPRADIAVAGAVIAAVRALVEEHRASQRQQRALETGLLAEILEATTRDADQAVLRSADYLGLFGFPGRGPCRAIDLWQHIVETSAAGQPHCAEWADALSLIVRRGCLARRICDAAGPNPQPERLRAVYRRLSDCLRDGALFEGDAV
jgi:gamma-glutamyl:cysteine ligase YbdK (ATP-grasp superfamily)